jgi:hypothetical protein
MEFRLVTTDKLEEHGHIVGSITMIQERHKGDWKDRYGFSNEEEARSFLEYKSWLEYLIN